MKRVLSLLLAVVLAFSMVPNVFAQAETAEAELPQSEETTAIAEEPAEAVKQETYAATEGEYTYTVSGGEATITKYTGEDSIVSIPSTLGGYPVTGLQGEYYEDEWGDNRYNGVFEYDITSVTLPDSIITIGEGAFYDCWRLVAITIPRNVVTIGDYAFYRCDGLASVSIGDSVTVIGDYAFYDCCSLKSITIPNSVATIGSHAFVSCDGITSVAIPNSVTSIGKCVFGWCDSLASVIVGSGVTTISEGAFTGCDNLTSVTIPDSVTIIGDEAFRSCSNLRTITIPGSVTTIGVWAFNLCEGLNAVTIDYGVKTIGWGAFCGCDSLTSVVIPDSVTTIGDDAFSGCDNLTKVTIPSSVATIGVGAFSVCRNLSVISISADNPHFSSDSNGILFNKNKTTLIQATGVISGNYTIPSCVTAISDWAFDGCNKLTSVTIPASVTTIGVSAFGYCENITSILVNTNNPNFSSDSRGVLFNKNKTTLLQAPAKISGNYRIPNGVTSICDSAFCGCIDLTYVTIPDSVTRIDAWAFSECDGLSSVTIPARVISIGEGAFSYCDTLNSATIGDGVKTIGGWAFCDCYNLAAVTIPASVTTIGDNAFDYCDGLMDVYYGGTEAQWNEIAFGYDNEALFLAEITYNFVGHIHSYTKKVTMPTCTTKGYTTYTCECGDTYKDDELKALGHSYSAATCTKAKTCSRCKITSGNALGHTYSKGKCTDCGYKPVGAKITTQPVNVAVSNGKTAKVTVKASGDGLKYTWYYAKKGSSKFTKTTVTSASYSVKMSSSVDGGKVYCEVTDKYGNVVKSSTVTLYKGTPAKITTQPKSVTVANGKTGKLELKASGSSLKYQWYIKYKGASSYTKVGSSSKTYSFKMASKLNGAQAYCVVKDKYGISVKSSVVTIKLAAKPKVTTQPKSVTQVSGKTVKFTVKASGEGLKYQWYYAKKGSSSFKKLSGKTSATYSVKVSSSVNGRKYYCLVTDKYGQTVKSSAVTLTLKTVAKITTQPKSVTVKNGSTAKVTIKAAGDGLKYTWYYLKPGATKYTKASVTSATFSVKMAAAWKNAKVYCVIADKYGNTVKSKVVTMKMK